MSVSTQMGDQGEVLKALAILQSYVAQSENVVKGYVQTEYLKPEDFPFHADGPPTCRVRFSASADFTPREKRLFPKIIVMCGSSRFIDIMAVCQWLLERDEGAIVMGLHLLPWWYATNEEIPDHLAEHEGVADEMDELHLRKIDLADEIFVVNKDFYVGVSTDREVRYAREQGKPIRWFTDDPIGDAVEAILREKVADNVDPVEPEIGGMQRYAEMSLHFNGRSISTREELPEDFLTEKTHWGLLGALAPVALGLCDRLINLIIPRWKEV